MWNLLKQTFKVEDAFTVLFHLNNGTVFNLSLVEPHWPDFIFANGYFTGTNVETQQPVTISAQAVCAYEIEY